MRNVESTALNSFDKAQQNGWWGYDGGCSVSVGDGITLEQCAQRCLEQGNDGGGFEVYLPSSQSHCWWFNRPFDELTDANCGPFIFNPDCEKYDRIGIHFYSQNPFQNK